MPRPRSKAIDLLRLVRPELVYPGISGLWLMVLLALRADAPAGTGHAVNPALADQPLALALLLAAVVAAGLHIYGAALNDMLDLRHDRVFAPDRPLAAGEVSLRAALGLAVLGLLAAMLAAGFFGLYAGLLCLLAALSLFFYSAAGKYLPGLGVLSLGIIRAAVMLVPDPQAVFLWPVWLAMTHVILVGAVGHLLRGKRPRLEGGHWAILIAGWAFLSLGLSAWIRWREPASGHAPATAWLWPALAVAGLLGWMWWLPGQLGRSPPRRRRELVNTFQTGAACWLIVYDAAWLLAAGLAPWALAPAGLLVAVLLTRRLVRQPRPA